jgi:hypothetical protein
VKMKTTMWTILSVALLLIVCRDATSYVIKTYEHEDNNTEEKRELEEDLDKAVEQDLNTAFDLKDDDNKDETEMMTPKREYQDAMDSRVVDDESCITDCAGQPLSPYCGTNGITYASKCELYNAVCRSGGTIDQKSKGPCASKDQESDLRNYISNMMFKDDAKKDGKENHPGHKKREETCITNCAPYGEDPYCATNGITYKNKCEMYNAICRSGGKFDAKGKGPCGRKDNEESHSKRGETCISDCSSSAYDPYCGSNGVTYNSKCDLYNAQCKTNGAVTIKAQGECGELIYTFFFYKNQVYKNSEPRIYLHLES